MKHVTLCLFTAALIACQAEVSSEPDDYTEAGTDTGSTEAVLDPATITPGNGVLNQIEISGIERQGPSLIVPAVVSETDAFLVLHPFADGAPVRTDYVGSTFVPAGTSNDVFVRLDGTPAEGTPFIIMLHTDVNGDGTFQFGDGITVPDAPVLEGTTLIALPMQVPASGAVTPDLVRASYREHADKAQAFLERADYRSAKAETRIRAMIHEYLHAVERSDRSIDHVTPLLAEEFAINFPSGPITSAEQLSNWLTGPASAFVATRHVLHDVSFQAAEGDAMIVSMQMKWDGLTEAGDRMSARTQHQWRVIELEGSGWPKIQTINVEIIEPFAPTDW